jgi:hypothetical protein
LTECWRIQQAREDRRASLPAWILASVHRDPETRSEPFTFEEVCVWLGHGFVKAHPDAVVTTPTPEDLLERARVLNRIYGGVELNGTG